MKLGVALGAHTHGWETLAELVREAEALGYSEVAVDGDVTRYGSGECLDGWTVTQVLLARTERIVVRSLRLPHHWSPAKLAHATATAHRIFGERFRFLTAAGAQRVDRRFGLPFGPPAERIARLGATLESVRALWRGETVTRHDAFVALDGASLDPAPGELPITIAGRDPRTLALVAEHASGWELNLPPIAGRVQRVADTLAEACRARGRDPAGIARSQWIFTRLAPGRDPRSALPEFRQLNPWFAGMGEDELPEALAVGDAPACRAHLERIRTSCGLDLPILDLTGLDAPAARRVLEALAPAARER